VKITFPHMGNAWIVIQTLFGALDLDVVVPPPSSKQTLNLGTKIAPESACLPLKINLGNYIEAAALGADTIVITGGVGPCRFGYYGELERAILREAGYDYEVIVLEAPNGSLAGLAQRIRHLAGNRNSWPKILNAIRFAYHKSIAIDQVEDMIHKYRPRAKHPTLAEALYTKAKRRLLEGMSEKSLKETVEWVRNEVRNNSVSNRDPLRVGIVGEIYTILDPFSSVDIERYLGGLGVEVDRSIYLSGWVGQHVFQGLSQGYRSLKPYHQKAKPYLSHFVGGHGQESVGAAAKFAADGFDGIIHLLPLSCMPEIVAASILPRVQEDHNLPVMSLTVDELTGAAGIHTRLEAFVDLIERSRQEKRAKREDVLSIAGR